MALPNSNAELVQYLVAHGVLKTPRLVGAFKAIDRAQFVPPGERGEAYGDYPLPIGYSQTISQPSTVALMLEWLQPQSGQNILEIGAGCGYVTALLAKVVGEKGHLVALEIIPELAAQARRNLAAYHFTNFELLEADGSRGYAPEVPYSGIIVSAAAVELPPGLKEQLTTGGRLVIPVGEHPQAMAVIERTSKGFRERSVPGFEFVPLVHRE